MKRASAPSYDLFKLIVTVILVTILLLMLLRGCATSTSAGLTAATVPPGEEVTSVPPTAGVVVSSMATETFTASAMPATVASTATITQIAPTQTIPAAMATEIVSTPEASATPAATTSVTEQTTHTPEGEASCNTSVPSRLAVGQKARVVQRLNMRFDSSITATIIQTNPTGTQVDIIGGPVCTQVGDTAYLWWQIRLPNGAEGWSAESQLNERSYLLEPIP